MRASIRMTETDALKAQAERIRSSGILGRSRSMQNLFFFLLECTLKNRVPKEIEITIDGLRRGDTFGVPRDTPARVYVHKLRKRLEDFYAGPGRGESHHLVIPRGKYQLAVAQAGTNSVGVKHKKSPTVELSRSWLWYAGTLLLFASVLANISFFWIGHHRRGVNDLLEEVRASSVWAPLLDDQLPIYVVVGDYYVFGEVDELLSVKRLVRDFSVNSRAEFDRATEHDATFANRYQDLNLAYLPTGSAFAMRALMPLLAVANDRVKVVMATDINADLLKAGHVIYLGYFSGMGSLREIVFAGSRLEPGESFDELRDVATGESYISDVGAAKGRLKYRDYGYFSTFSGPSGNQFVIIAGTRDIAVMRMASVATSITPLTELRRQSHDDAFETLYEVYGYDRVDIDATRVMTSPRVAQSIWRDQPEPEQHRLARHNENRRAIPEISGGLSHSK